MHMQYYVNICVFLVECLEGCVIIQWNDGSLQRFILYKLPYVLGFFVLFLFYAEVCLCKTMK